MRAHPVKALNLIQDSTRHRWHEATATKTALGPSANLQPSAKPWVRLAQGRMVQRDSIKRLLPRSGPPLPPANTRLRAPWRRPAVCHLFFRASLARRLPDTGSDRCSLHAWPHRARFGRIVRIEDVAAGIRRTNFDDSLREADHSFRRDRRPRDHGTEPRSAGPSGRASQHPTGPFSKSEMKFVASVSVADLERQADQLSKTFRELGTRIQELNLEDGCDLRVVGSQAGQGGREPSQG